MDNWNFTEIINLFTSNTEIKKSLGDETLDDIHELDTAWATLVRTALEYQGFDPIKIFKQMIKNQKAYYASNKTLIMQ